MSFYTVIARLLEYPTQALIDSLHEIPQALSTINISHDEKKVVLNFTQWVATDTLIKQQAFYVDTFDVIQEHSLHITHHLYGESKERGPALANMIEYYGSHGFNLSEKELPDFLPVILEFIAQLDEMGAKVFLADAGKALVILRENLEQAKNPYASLVKLLEQRGNLAGIAA